MTKLTNWCRVSVYSLGGFPEDINYFFTSDSALEAVFIVMFATTMLVINILHQLAFYSVFYGITSKEYAFGFATHVYYLIVVLVQILNAVQKHFPILYFLYIVLETLEED